ncbi:Septin-9, partial [Ophiophagus hannah]
MEDDLAGEPTPQDGPALKTTDGGLFGYVGIEAVLDQMRIKTMKTGFEFNIMVVGQSGLGKSTMVNTLFKSKISRKSACSGYEERIPKTVQLLSVTHIVEEKGVKMKLTVTDTPGFGDQINNQNCWEPIIQYINDQYERYLKEEILINRKQKIPDTRVHACVYFVPPTGHWLRPLDLEFMRRLSKITNVVPVIAKADTLTLEERAEFKQREKIPFAVVGADKEHQVNGKKVLGRKTKWGIIEVENSAHCEFPLLRDLLIRVHYEQYRIQRLNESNRLAKGGEWLALSSLTYEPQGQHRLPCNTSAPPPLQ